MPCSDGSVGVSAVVSLEVARQHKIHKIVKSGVFHQSTNYCIGIKVLKPKYIETMKKCTLNAGMIKLNTDSYHLLILSDRSLMRLLSFCLVLLLLLVVLATKALSWTAEYSGCSSTQAPSSDSGM